MGIVTSHFGCAYAVRKKDHYLEGILDRD